MKVKNNLGRYDPAQNNVVRDSSAVRRLFVRLAGAVGHQSALHKENSGFATPTLGRHISTFRGYQILFSIRNPFINRFTNHFSVHSQPSYPQKVVLHSITARFCLRPYHFVIWLSFSNICHITSRKLRRNDYRNVSWEMMCIYMILLCPKWEGVGGERKTCTFRSPWVTLPLNLFFPTHFLLFPSALIWAVDGTVCPAEYALYHACCCLRMQIIWHTALSCSHHSMCCCHHSVSIARSRL
jgi:hypothetical protein